MSEGHSEHGHSHSGHDEQVGHIAPVWLLVATWAVLMVMTYLTVTATQVDLGPLNLWLAMGIATFKASLVVLFFMHLVYDRPFNSVVFIGSLCFVMLFIILALLDTGQYQPHLIPGYAPGMPAPPQ
jgi:cytochrome c oxidase subunit 4